MSKTNFQRKNTVFHSFLKRERDFAIVSDRPTFLTVIERFMTFLNFSGRKNITQTLNGQKRLGTNRGKRSRSRLTPYFFKHLNYFKFVSLMRNISRKINYNNNKTHFKAYFSIRKIHRHWRLTIFNKRSDCKIDSSTTHKYSTPYEYVILFFFQSYLKYLFIFYWKK